MSQPQRKVSVAFEMPDIATPGELVSPAEIEFFRDNGFFVKKGLLDAIRLEGALDRIWTHLLAEVPIREDSDWKLLRDDRATWVNPQWAAMPPNPTSGPFQGRHPIEHVGRIVKLHDLGGEEFLLNLLPNDHRVRAVATTLLGENLRPTERIRGVYAVFPTKDPAEPHSARRISGRALGPHTDQVCQQLNACAYLEDVRPRNGGLTVYPGSHHIMFRAHQYESNWSPLPTYEDCVRRVVADVEPWEICAEGGSVIFWHGRMLHSVGIHVGDDIRWAVFADFTRNLPVLSDDEHRALGQYEWFKDAKLFRHDQHVGEDMWRNWAMQDHANPLREA